MRAVTFQGLFLGLIAALAITLASPASAETVRWPASTMLPKLPPPLASPPAVLERAASVVAAKAHDKNAKGDVVCKEGRVCVICVAACDLAPPVVVQRMKPRPTGAPVPAGVENDSDGVADNAPRFARQEWAGITCGTESGCRVSGVSAPRRSLDIDVRMTIIRPTRGGASSWYID